MESTVSTPSTRRPFKATSYSTVELARDIQFADGTSIPAGAMVLIAWGEYPATVNELRYFRGADPNRIYRLSGRSIGRAIAGALPRTEDLEEWTCDSVCETPTGDSVEPDGIGPDGCPSWLLLLEIV